MYGRTDGNLFYGFTIGDTTNILTAGRQPIPHGPALAVIVNPKDYNFQDMLAELIKRSQLESGISNLAVDAPG